MADFEQKTDDYGTTILKLIRVKEVGGGSVRLFGHIMLSIKHYKESDTEMMIVRLISLAGNTMTKANLSNVAASEKLSLNKFTATVNHRTNSVDFGPVQGGYLEESLRGRGIGSFGFNELISWLKSNFAVNPFEFLSNENASPDEIERRNKFLESFGFTLGFTDVTQKSGTMKAKKVSVLKERYNAEKIEELDIEQFVFNLINDKASLEKSYSDLKTEYAARGEELLAGIPKSEIVKYTIVGCVLVLLIMILLMV